MHTRTLTRLLATAILAAVANGAAAQYIWINEKGLKEVSDRPPPTSTPQKNILKQPSTGRITSTPVTETPAGEAAPAAPAAPPKTGPTLAERDAEFRKRKAEQAVKEQKEEEEAKVAGEKRRACDNARTAQSQLKTNPLIVRKGPNGQPAFMTDAERAQESGKTQKALEDCK